MLAEGVCWLIGFLSVLKVLWQRLIWQVEFLEEFIQISWWFCSWLSDKSFIKLFKKSFHAPQSRLNERLRYCNNFHSRTSFCTINQQTLPRYHESLCIHLVQPGWVAVAIWDSINHMAVSLSYFHRLARRNIFRTRKRRKVARASERTKESMKKDEETWLEIVIGFSSRRVFKAYSRWCFNAGAGRNRIRCNKSSIVFQSWAIERDNLIGG